MKKFLLPLFAMGMIALPAMADEVYGTSPETAKPFPVGGWFLPTLDDAPAEVWFTITNNQAAPINWGSAPTAAERQIFVYLCDGGSEAFQWVEGTDSYALMPGQEYVVKITPKAAGNFCFGSGTNDMVFPEAWKGKYKFYPIDKREEQNTAILTTPGTTWYLYDFNYPSPLVIKPVVGSEILMDKITEVEAIHIECPGGTNIGDALVAPHVKAGKSVIGVTIAEDAVFENAPFISLDAFTALSCNNNLLRGQALQLDQKTTYPDAYYTVDKFFRVPEDGTYTFKNHGAKGTILNVGKVVLTDPNNEFKSECDWTDIKTATVGEDDAAVVVDLKAGEIVAVQSDAFGIIGEGLANAPYLLVEKGNTASVAGVAEDDQAIVASVAGGVLNVKSVLLASGAKVAVYDMSARKVAEAAAPQGASEFNMGLDVAPGTYAVVVYGKGNSETVKVVVK